ncbi:amino acid permease [Kitasatospora phosalacinea]|uniref:amino acid permease n=1 Tax=Kitasatospora phosalacinea TaxID=2065 RepID=UPI00052710A6|nr:amino acid permease [Kitasatospora phosalacinea]
MSAADVPSPDRGTAAVAAERVKAVAVPRTTRVTLALMTTGSVASLRSAPTVAVYGPAGVFLYVVPAIVIMVLHWTGVWVSSRGTGAVASPVLIVNNFLSYSGMEMNAVHVSSLKDPGREFPRSMFPAVGMVLLIFILPAPAISWVVPADQLSLTAGVMQAFDAFFQYFHIGRPTPLIAVGLVAASLGGMLTWPAGPSKGLLMISRQEGYLPPSPQKPNSHGVQQNIPAAMRLRKLQPDHPRGFRAPAPGVLCAVGLPASAAAAMVIGFVPSSQFGGGGVRAYVGIIGGGLLLLGVIIPFAFLKAGKPRWRGPAAAAAVAGGTA